MKNGKSVRIFDSFDEAIKFLVDDTAYKTICEILKTRERVDVLYEESLTAFLINNYMVYDISMTHCLVSYSKRGYLSCFDENDITFSVDMNSSFKWEVLEVKK